MSLSNLTEQIQKKNILSYKRTDSQLKYRRFNLLLLFSIFLPMLLVGGVNWIIDPYDIFKPPYWGKLNHNKVSKDDHDRLYKAVDVMRIKPLTIILGSSRTKQGLNPEHPALSNQPAYNLGLNGTNIYESLHYLQHTIKNQPNLKTVVIGIDFFMFNEYRTTPPTFSENRLEKTHINLKDSIDSLFSLDSVLNSKNTIIASLDKPQGDRQFGSKGFFPHTRTQDGKTQWRFKDSILQYFALNPNYTLSQSHLSDFKALVKLCQENNIELKVFISPSHAIEWEILRQSGQWEIFEQWKRELVKITPVWDFSGYNSITTEKIKPIMKNYADHSHYTVPIGNLVLDKILSYHPEQVPTDFGILMTRENIEQHLQQVRDTQKVWLEKNPDEIKLVSQLKQQFEQENQSK